MRNTLIIAILLLAGCGREPQRNQAAADALAGTDAMVLVAPEVQPIATGTADHILAARGVERRDQLPPPRMQPAAIVANVPAYQEQGKAAIQESLSPGWWAAIIGGGIGLLGLAGRLGLLGPIGGWIAGALTPARQAVAQVRTGNLAGAGLTMISTLETAPPEIAKPIKALLSKAFSPEQEAEVRRVLAEMAQPAVAGRRA